MDFLPTLWFILIAVLWTGYLFLEGFDLGVGMHMLVSARTENDRRVMLNTIGPVWDGNEVWLITAAGATFAAFPFWYASLVSTLYVPFVVVPSGFAMTNGTYFRMRRTRLKATWLPASVTSPRRPAQGAPVSTGGDRVRAGAQKPSSDDDRVRL